jgi:hypothetical protein
MEQTPPTTYSVIYKDWTYKENLQETDLAKEQNILCFIQHSFAHFSKSGKTAYFSHQIQNINGQKTEIRIGNFVVNIGSEYWLGKEEYKNNAENIFPDRVEYKHYIRGMSSEKVEKLKINFYYPHNLELEVNLKSPRGEVSMAYLVSILSNPYGSKCCWLYITNVNTEATDVGRINLGSGTIAQLVCSLCKELENYNSIPDWRTKQLIDFIQPELDYLSQNIDSLDKDNLVKWKEYLNKFSSQFNFYLDFMKKRDVDIAEYLQLLENKI